MHSCFSWVLETQNATSSFLDVSQYFVTKAAGCKGGVSDATATEDEPPAKKPKKDTKAAKAEAVKPDAEQSSLEQRAKSFSVNLSSFQARTKVTLRKPCHTNQDVKRKQELRVR